MKIVIALLAAIPLLLACRSTDEAPGTPTTAATMIATARPSDSATPTPECDLKCETLRNITPTPTRQISPPAPFYPAGTRSGSGEVDAIVAAIESRDAARLANLITLTTVPCEEPRPQSPQPQRCPDGVPVGSPLTGVWMTHVEGGLWQVTRDEMATRILQHAREQSWKLHSVYSYEKAGRKPDWMPETDYFITFAVWYPQVGAEFDNLRVVDGRITGLHFAFPEPGDAWNKPADPGWLLPRAK